MNSRERVLAAVNHREPDRVPIDLGGTRQSGIAASTYHQLKSRLGISSPTRVYDVYQMLSEVERPVLERFGADVIGLNRPAVAFGIVNANWKPWRLFDGAPVEVPGGFKPVTEESGDLVLLRDGRIIARMPKDGYYFDRLEVYPGGSHTPVDEVSPPVMSDELCDHYAAQAEALHQNTDFAVIAPMGPPYELFYGLGTGGFETWMMALAAEPDYVNSLCEKLVDVWLEDLRRFSQAVGDRVQILQFNDDFGTPDEVANEVREHVSVFAPGGGYVFAPVHNIQANVPPENVIAMFDAVSHPYRG